MSKKPESRLIANVHKHLPSSVYKHKEHNPYTAGIPDCYYYDERAELWVEYKYVPKRVLVVKGDKLLTALQKRWLDKRVAKSRPAAVIVGTPEGNIILPDGAWNYPQTTSTRLTHQQTAEWIKWKVCYDYDS